MTYSLIEKEETIYEQQIDELFNLTEFDIATRPEQGIGSGKQYEYRDQDGKLWTGNSEFLNKIAHGDSTGHHLDIYKNTPSPKNISGTGITTSDTIEINPDDEGGETDPPILIPPIRAKIKKVVPKKVAPTKPKPKLIPTKPKPKLIPTKPKPKLIPSTPVRPTQLPPLKKNKLQLPVRPTQLPPLKKNKLQLPVRPTQLPPLEEPKLKLKPLSPRNQIASKMAQGEIDKIIKKLQNNKTTLPQGKKLLTQLNKLEQLKKPLQLTIPRTQIPKRFGLPDAIKPKLVAPNLKLPTLEPPKISKLDVPKPQLLKPSNLVAPKLGVPTPGSLIPKVMSDADLAKLLPKGKAPTITIPKALATEIEVTRKKLATAQKKGNKGLANKLTNHLKKQLGTYVDPDIAQKRVQAKAASSAIQKADAEALAQRKAKQAAEKVTAQAAEKARLAKIAKDAEQAALAKQTAQQQEVPKSPEQQKIEQDIDTKQKAKVEADKLKAKVEADRLKATAVKEPTPQSNMAKGMVQPKKGQGIKSFAKQLGYDTVEEFEKANPKGVGIDKKTGNKFVKTGVSYIDQQAAGVANELDNAKRLLNKETMKPKSKQNAVRIDKLEKQIDALSGKTTKPPTVVGKPAPGIKDMRKMSFAKGLSYSKVYATLAKRAAAKGLAKAGGYLVPGLNIAILAWDAHELVVGSAGITSAYGSWDRQGKQQDLNQINAILDSEATIAEKRKAIETFGEGKELTHRFGPKGAKTVGMIPGEQGGKRWDKDGDEHDPPLPFELKNVNGRKMDINTVPIEKYEEVIANHVTENMAPYTQKDLNVLINRIETMKEHAISGGKRKATQRQIDAYDAKIKKLAEIRKTYPKSRKEAFKNLFTMMVDVHEQEQAKGEVYDFANKKTETGSALENALARAYEADMEEHNKQNVKRKKERDAGFMSFSNWGDSSVGRFVDNTIDGIAGDPNPSYAYIEPGSKDDTSNTDNTATASMGVATSKNNDPEVVTTVGTPYGNNPGAPADFQQYETLMKQVSNSFDLPIAVVRALAMQESGMHASGGTLGPWSYTGDHTLGKKGAFGPFHVRSDPDKGAALEHFNEVKGTTYTWKDIASNGMLAAKVGATYFKHWYDKTGGDAQKAYELYNGGPSGYMKTQSIANAKKFKERLDKFNESRNFANKSAILEGIALTA